MNLHDSIIQIKGIGSQKQKAFYKLNIDNIGSLLDYYPSTYEFRESINSIKDGISGNKILIKARIIYTPIVKRIRNNLIIIQAKAQDEFNNIFELVWYNVPYIKNQLKIDIVYCFYGKLNVDRNRFKLESPEFVVEKNIDQIEGILPKYSLTKGITQKDIRKAVKNVLQKDVNIYDYLNNHILDKYALASYEYALNNIHYPRSREDLMKAKERLIINEFIEILSGFKYLKDKSNEEYIPLQYNMEIQSKLSNLIISLPFTLTVSQQKVWKELLEDVKCKRRINRLIQGDVGSGKTILAILMIYLCLLNGYQSVMMVPTGILAEQHYKTIVELYNKLGIETNILLMTNFKSRKRRIETLKRIAEGKVQIIIATHSVIQEDVEFDNLALVITDEQHRFGVKQRQQLNNKGLSPHALVMSATPIPRTISLALYGDLDISTMETLPEGRKNIKTYCVNTNYRQRIYKFLKEHVEEGRQVYIICPAIDENESLESATIMYENLKNTSFKGYPIGLIHGKLSSEEKEYIMNSFYDNKIKVLVATTVIEVGINVPNATVMVIENADRFGLAQLHQLRGRVGRSNMQSYCILITEQDHPKIMKRLNVLVESNDGFYISEKDLELRGPGDYFGFHQHGLPAFKLANPIEHQGLLLKAQEIVAELIDTSNDSENGLKNIISVFNKKIKDIAMN